MCVLWDNPIKFYAFRYLSFHIKGCLQKKMLILCSRDRGWGGGGQIKIVFKNPKMSDFFSLIWEKVKPKFYHFWGFEDKRGVGGSGDLNIVFRRQNISDFFLQTSLNGRSCFTVVHLTNQNLILRINQFTRECSSNAF